MAEEEKIREILEKLSERDRRLLREILLREREKDKVCREFGVDRGYLRVLLNRTKESLKSVLFGSAYSVRNRREPSG